MILYNTQDPFCTPRVDALDAGMDLRTKERVILRAGETKCIPLGIVFSIPPGRFVQLSARSSTAMRGVYCHIGTIDSSFNGREVKAILTNISGETVVFEQYERIVQAIDLEHGLFQVTNKTIDSRVSDGSNRVSKKGFGSTGRS